jgi:ADP-ribose pyrophosphatase YjhB (NUDIX family)
MEKLTRFGIGVFLFIFNKDFSKILLVRRNLEKRDKYGFAWGTVGGVLEFREYSIDGAIREAKEEIGVEFKKSEVKLMEVNELPHFTKEVHGIAFKYASVLDEKTKITINEESDGYQWFSLDNLPEDRTLDDDILAIAKIAKRRFEK